MADQILSIINKAAKDVLGKQAFTSATDTSSLVSLGCTLDDLQLKDPFYNKFHKQISKVVYEVSKIKRRDGGIVKDVIDFNTALMLIEANDLPDATNNNSIWSNVGGTMSDGGQKDPFGSDIDGEFDFDIQYFNKWATWSFEKMIPEYQHGGLFSENYVGFTNMIYTLLANAFDLAINNTVKLAKATAIATTYASATADGGNTAVYRNLLSEYNDKYDKALTVDTCMADSDFLRYALYEISLVIDRVKEPSYIFSPTKKLRWLDDNEISVEMLSVMDKALTTYLYADTYHENLIHMKGYDGSITTWQGIGNSFDFDDISKVSVITEDGKGAGSQGADVPTTVNGVVAWIHDNRKCMVTMDKERSHTVYNARSEVVNIFEKCDIAYACNKNAISVIFTIEDEVVTS